MGKIKSDWKEINAGVPQRTILAPMFFLIMINDLTTTLPLYKYVVNQSYYAPNGPQHKENKRIPDIFPKDPISDQLTINNISLDTVQSFKLLGITISSDLTWNIHVDNICAKASKRLYALRILKRNGVPAADLLTIFCTFIRLVLEYACQVWHTSLSSNRTCSKKSDKDYVPSSLIYCFS
jgi:hypothetical protein